MCTECTLTFFMSPVKSGIVAFSFVVSAFALALLFKLKSASTRQRLGLLYLHAFGFAFPFLFYFFFRGCQQYFSACSQFKAVLIVLGLAAAAAGIISLVLAPFLFIRKYLRSSKLVDSGRLHAFMLRSAESLGITNLKLYVIDSALPMAFSYSLFRPRIFVSAGLFDILGRAEIEAIVLHELAHLKSRSSIVKFWGYFARLLSPLAFLAQTGFESDEEEADRFAVKIQGSCRHIDSAKAKIFQYNAYAD